LVFCHPCYPWYPWSSAPLPIGALVPQLRHRSQARAGSNSSFSFFFENFAPPFPEKEVRDGNIQKKESKNNY
jgi:hypothetical protein